jgi:hypothetical protein
MGWAPRTDRGFLAALAKKGIMVEVLDRVRQIGPNGLGTKGSYTVYHIETTNHDRRVMVPPTQSSVSGR